MLEERYTVKGFAVVDSDGHTVTPSELARILNALVRWHESNGTIEFASVDEDLAIIAAALAQAGVKQDG